MKHAAIISHIRQLCCLGLGGEAMMPAVHKALHGLVPSQSNGFFWVDEHYEMTNICAEQMLPPDVMRLYFSEFYNRREREAGVAFSEMVRTPTGIVVRAPTEQIRRTDYYNLILRHLGADQVLYAPIRERGRCLGLLSVYRGVKDLPFSEREQQRLAAVTRYIAHGLTARADTGCGGYHDSEQSGLVVLDKRGTLRYLSPQGRKLLFLATHPQISRITATSGDTVPAQVLRLCEDLCRVFEGKPATPPVSFLENPWGKFVFRAYWLDQGQAEGDALIGVTVQHQEPLQLTLLRPMQALGLPGKQKEVALLLAEGLSHSDIAERLSVSLNTANYHVKQLYTRLDVHDRGEMVRRLLGSQ